MEFNVGDKVSKSSGDYTYPGIVVSRFVKLNGNIRYVVECTCEACKGMLHIFSGKDLKHD